MEGQIDATRFCQAPWASIQAAFALALTERTNACKVALNDNFIRNTYQPIVNAGRRAAELEASVQAFRGICTDAEWGTEAKAQAALILEGLGIASASAEMFATSAQKFQAAAMDRLLTLLVAQKAPHTTTDWTRAQRVFEKLTGSLEASEFVLDFAQTIADIDQRRARYYEETLPLAQVCGDLTRIDREWRKIQGSIWVHPSLQRWS